MQAMRTDNKCFQHPAAPYPRQAGSFFGGYPSAGSFARSAINFKAGSKSPGAGGSSSTRVSARARVGASVGESECESECMLICVTTCTECRFART